MRREDVHMFFGLKWDPFQKNIPVEGIVVNPKVAKFAWRIENLVMDGGFALISGGHGLGKSIALRILEDRLGKLREASVGTILRPQSGIGDFYREMGHNFGLQCHVSNRWASFKTLRQKWQHHIESTLIRPVLLIDEAQEVPVPVLSELRFLAAEKFDSRSLLTVVLAGDDRLNDRLRTEELQPLGSRISPRLVMEPLSREELIATLTGCLEKAGGPKLMTEDVVNSLADHSAGNPRIMMNMAHDLLIEAFKKEAKQIDEKLYFETFDHFLKNQNSSSKKRRPLNVQE